MKQKIRAIIKSKGKEKIRKAQNEIESKEEKKGKDNTKGVQLKRNINKENKI